MCDLEFISEKYRMIVKVKWFLPLKINNTGLVATRNLDSCYFLVNTDRATIPLSSIFI